MILSSKDIFSLWDSQFMMGLLGCNPIVNKEYL
jgi:hypothetical protein